MNPAGTSHLVAEEAKAALLIPDLWRRLNVPGELRRTGAAGWLGSVPWREDRHPSLSVSADGQLWIDRARGDEGGDAIGFLARFCDLDRKQAFRRFLEMVDLGTITSRLTSVPPFTSPTPKQRANPNLPPSREGTTKEFRTLAALRGLSPEGVEQAGKRGLCRYSILRGTPVWIVTDSTRTNAQARRLDGQPWPHLNGAKAWTLPGARAGWPLGASAIESFPAVVLTEGGPDLLAACHFIYCEGREESVAPVAMLGASMRLPEDALPLFAGKRVRLYPHMDPAGQEAAARWNAQLTIAGANVDLFHFDGLLRLDGQPVTDLNDLALLNADCFDAERGNLESILP